jgi:SAM-dependent methyltransferase
VNSRCQPTNFDIVADEYDESLPAHVVDHYLAKRTAFILSRVPLGNVLDVGCGTGLLAERLCDLGYTVTGLDQSRGMLQHVHKRRRDIPVVVGESTLLPFRDDAFSLTYCVAVLHHVADPGAVRQTLREMARVTRPGGFVLIWDHNAANPYWPILMRRVPQDSGAERLVSAPEILAGLRSGGAEPVLVRQLGLIPDFVPRRFLGAAARAERVIERIPVVNRICAHNVVMAVKNPHGLI